MAETSKILHLEGFDEDAMRSRIRKILVPEPNHLLFVFTDGEKQEVEWHHTSRRKSWTPEMREAARQRTLARYRKESSHE